MPPGPDGPEPGFPGPAGPLCRAEMDLAEAVFWCGLAIPGTDFERRIPSTVYCEEWNV